MIWPSSQHLGIPGFGWKVVAKLNSHVSKLSYRTIDGYCMGTSATKLVIQFWQSYQPNTLHYCTTAKFFEYITLLPGGTPSPGSRLTQDLLSLPLPLTIMRLLFPKFSLIGLLLGSVMWLSWWLDSISNLSVNDCLPHLVLSHIKRVIWTQNLTVGSPSRRNSSIW